MRLTPEALLDHEPNSPDDTLYIYIYNIYIYIFIYIYIYSYIYIYIHDLCSWVQNILAKKVAGPLLADAWGAEIHPQPVCIIGQHACTEPPAPPKSPVLRAGPMWSQAKLLLSLPCRVRPSEPTALKKTAAFFLLPLLRGPRLINHFDASKPCWACDAMQGRLGFRV